MGRHTGFRFTVDPSPGQAAVLARHVGAARFAYNQCLRLVKDALDARVADASVVVPWSGFDLINAFNAWKRSPAAGRVLVVDLAGTVAVAATGLAWRGEVPQQVFEEAAVDLGRGLAAYAAGRGQRPSPVPPAYGGWIGLWRVDRDVNAAANLAVWAEQHHAQTRDPDARARLPTPPEGRH
jgi:helix-turn-helix protein